MKKLFRTRIPLQILVLVLAGWLVVEAAHQTAVAGPSTAPSALAAIRLKYYPPNNWIRHYLGDDRYKIAGNVWKVVSTQMDTYYHRPTCPNMMKQQAGIVIGFADSVEAEEAGYAPDPLCAPAAPVVTYTRSSSSGSGGAAANPFAPATRNTLITLSDGTSTTVLPTGWIHLKNDAQKNPVGETYGASFDLLIPSSSLRSKSAKPAMLMFLFMNAPNGVRVEPLLVPDRVARLKEQFRNSSKSSGFVKILDNSKLSSATLGGLKGLKISPQNNQGGLGGMPATIVGRGSKMYILANGTTTSTKGASTAIRSFQPR